MATFSERERAQVVKIVSLCTVWYFSSSTGNVIAKVLLTEFPYPVTLTMVQHLCLILNLAPLLRCWGVQKLVYPISPKYYLTIILPVAAGKFIANVSASFSIWKVPLSYAHTVKATMPLWTVALSRLILGEKHQYPVYFSLVPIIVGVIIATMTEISFEMSGLIAALIATMGFSLQNIFTKKTMKDTGIHHLRLLLLLAKISAACFFPIWIMTDVRSVFTEQQKMRESSTLWKCLGLLMLDGYLNFIQNLVAFSLISLITPLSYAVANATKRITIITFSILMMRNPVTVTNVFGMSLAVAGVFLYNRAKLKEIQEAKARSLPLTKSEVDLTKIGVMNQHYRSVSSSNGGERALANGFLRREAKSETVLVCEEEEVFSPHASVSYPTSSHQRLNILGTRKHGNVYDV